VCAFVQQNQELGDGSGSECRNKIDVENATTINCSLTNSTHTITFMRPFDGPSDTSEAAVRVCGDRAYYVLPKKCSGCCYPDLMNVGTSVYLLGKQLPMVSGNRDINNILPGTLPKPPQGYVHGPLWKLMSGSQSF